MKKMTIILVSILLVCSKSDAQVVAKPLKKTITLNMPGDNGSNGASVAWHPVLKKYYASFAGNASFPFSVFDVTGKLLSPVDLEARFDVRGLWYNAVSKKIEGNGYDDNGWVSYKLDNKGLPQDIEQIHEGQVQPDPNSVGVYDGAKKRICFMKDESIYSYSLKGEEASDIIKIKSKNEDNPLSAGDLEDDSDQYAEYNETALCYTGIPNAEFGILNYGEMQIELYNRKGILTKAFKLPDDVALYNNFNFAYANGIWWLFDKDQRKWLGFK